MTLRKELRSSGGNNGGGMVLNLQNERFGLLTVIVEAIPNASHRRWTCLCDCGRIRIVSQSNLKRGFSKSCGCRRKQSNRNALKHGHSNSSSSTHNPSPEYYSWSAMLHRCYCPTDASYRWYGGRGITVCSQWQGAKGFETFLVDMGSRPPGYSLDRYPNNDGNYEPGNCRWATRMEQSRGQRRRRGSHGQIERQHLRVSTI